MSKPRPVQAQPGLSDQPANSVGREYLRISRRHLNLPLYSQQLNRRTGSSQRY
jgi:hypothetical protein